MVDRLVQPFPKPEEDRGNVHCGGGEELLVTLGLVEGLAEELLGRAQVVVVPAHPGKADEGLRSVWTGFEPGDRLVEQLARPGLSPVWKAGEDRRASFAAARCASRRAG